MHFEINFDVAACTQRIASLQGKNVMRIWGTTKFSPSSCLYCCNNHSPSYVCHTLKRINLPMYTFFLLDKMCALAFFVSTYICLPSGTCQRIFTQHMLNLRWETSDRLYQHCNFVFYVMLILGSNEIKTFR